MCCRILLGHALVIIGWWVILVRIVSWHISLTWLWANSMKSTKSWTLLIVVVMVVAIHVSSIAYRSSSMIIVSIWTQEVVSVTIFTSWVMWLIMNLDVGLPELIQDWSGSFCIDGRDLGHDLSIIWTIIILTCWSCLLIWTDFGRTIFVSVSIRSKVFALGGLVWRSIPCIQKVSSWALLVINYSILLQASSKVVHSVSITCVKSISFELFQFSMCHLLGFLNLLWIELYLSSIDSAWPTSMGIRVISFFCWVNIAIIVVIWLDSWWIFTSSLSIGLSNPILKLINGLFFKLFTHLVFISIPWVLLLPIFIDVNTNI